MREIVLFNDDQEAVLRLLQAVIIAGGDTVLSARNGQEVVNLATARQVDAVILDSSMPGMLGEDAAARIKRLRPETPIIMFSGLPPLEPGNVHNVDAYVAKHDGVDAVLSVLQQFLDTPSPQRPPIRRFPRYCVHVPFSVVVDRSGELAMLRGVTTSIGEGGLGGKVEGRLQPGELVLIQVADSAASVLSEPRAKVRYCSQDVYGFEFLDVTPTQQAEVRRLCERLTASA
jgi:CheY-like chemotaxis protein